MSTDQEAEKAKPKETIEIKIVYGINKKLEVAEAETLGQVKSEALGLFDIDKGEVGNFHLQAKVEGEQDVELDEARTVADYHLKKEQKVVLAAGSPFGAIRA